MNNLFLATGPDEFLLKEFINQYKSASIKKYGEFAIESLRLDFTSIPYLTNNILSPPLFSEKKIIFLENFPIPPTPKVSDKTKIQLDDLLHKINNLPSSIVLFCISTNPDKRTKYFKSVKKEANKIFEHKSFDEKKDINKITEWIVQRFNKNKSNITQENAKFLKNFVGSNLYKLDLEITKLSLIKKKYIDRKDIEEACIKNEESIDFAFSNAIAKGKISEILKEFSILYKEYDISLVFNRDIISVIRTMIKIFLSIKSPNENSGLHPFVIKNMKISVSRFSKEKLINLHNELIKIDLLSKSGVLNLSGNTKITYTFISNLLYKYFKSST
jgi:DNA polymerase III delta subunit